MVDKGLYLWLVADNDGLLRSGLRKHIANAVKLLRGESVCGFVKDEDIACGDALREIVEHFVERETIRERKTRELASR